MNALAQRFIAMLLGWGTVGVVYHLCDRIQGPGYRLRPLPIDTLIPFSSSAVWLYLSFFLIVPLGYFLTPRSRVRWLTRAMQLSALGAGAIYLLWPTTLQYPVYAATGATATLLDWLIGVDSRQNCFPSLHAALTLLAVWSIAAGRRRVITALSVVWALAIAFSILQLRRHLFIDLVGGALLAWGCGWLAARLDTRAKQNRDIVYE